MKTLGIKLSSPKDGNLSEISWAIRDSNNKLLGIVPDDILFDDSLEFQVKDSFLKTKKHVYKIFKVKDVDEAKIIFEEYGSKYGNIFGAVAKSGDYLIISNSFSTNFSPEDAEHDAIYAMDWFQNMLK